MPYTHFGEIGDLWKHLPLCEILNEIKPSAYIDTNAAGIWHKLTHSANQQYGIEYFYNNIECSDILQDSVFYTTIESVNPKNELRYYFGSPGLALLTLRFSSNTFLFFDIESAPLQQINEYAEQLQISKKIATVQTDATAKLLELLPQYDKDTFVFIDPYNAFETTASGKTFFELFLEVISKGNPSMLWYGFNTLHQRDAIFKVINNSNIMQECNSKTCCCIEIHLHEIQKEIIPFNPGILGCGIIAAHIPHETITSINSLADELVTVYANATYNNIHNGSIKKLRVF